MSSTLDNNVLHHVGPFFTPGTWEKVSQQVYVVGKPLVYGKPVYEPLPNICPECGQVMPEGMSCTACVTIER